MTAETLRRWVRQAEVDAGKTDGVTSQMARENRELKRKNAELERTIEILKAATSFFARLRVLQRDEVRRSALPVVHGAEETGAAGPLPT